MNYIVQSTVVVGNSTTHGWDTDLDAAIKEAEAVANEHAAAAGGVASRAVGWRDTTGRTCAVWVVVYADSGDVIEVITVRKEPT